MIIPTYDERENIELIVGRVLAAAPHANVLVVDDGSPDGTGKVADAIAEADARVHVMHRSTKDGLGAAYIAGFRWGLAEGYDVLVEMDADGSHAPEQLHRLLGALDSADVVLGSRWVPGGSVVNWPRRRKLLSLGGNLYTRMALGIRLKDATGGYRAYKRSVLESIDYAGVASQGYCFQVDLTRRALDAGFHVVEVPITFVERVARRVEDERRHRARGVLAGHPVGSGVPRLAGTDGCARQVVLTDEGAARMNRAAPMSGDQADLVPRRARRTSRRSSSTSSRSAIVRRSMSMSQWVRGALTFLASGAGPSTSCAIVPSSRHSQVEGSSASSENGMLNSCPRAHR